MINLSADIILYISEFIIGPSTAVWIFKSLNRNPNCKVKRKHINSDLYKNPLIDNDYVQKITLNDKFKSRCIRHFLMYPNLSYLITPFEWINEIFSNSTIYHLFKSKITFMSRDNVYAFDDLDIQYFVREKGLIDISSQHMININGLMYMFHNRNYSIEYNRSLFYGILNFMGKSTDYIEISKTPLFDVVVTKLKRFCCSLKYIKALCRIWPEDKTFDEIIMYNKTNIIKNKNGTYRYDYGYIDYNDELSSFKEIPLSVKKLTLINIDNKVDKINGVFKDIEHLVLHYINNNSYFSFNTEKYIITELKNMNKIKKLKKLEMYGYKPKTIEKIEKELSISVITDTEDKESTFIKSFEILNTITRNNY